MERMETWDKIIVQGKSGQFVKDGRLAGMLAPQWEPAYTPYRWDAKFFASHTLASNIAGRIGGRVRIFDALEGVLR